MYAKCPAFRMIVHPFLPDPGQGVKLGAAAYCLEPKGQGLKDSHRPTTTRPIIPVICTNRKRVNVSKQFEFQPH